MDRRIIGCFFLLISAILKIGVDLVMAVTFLRDHVVWEMGKTPMGITLAVISLVIGAAYLILGEFEAIYEKKK